jgi:arsenate reductase
MYEYDKCDSCGKARKFLKENGLEYEGIAIRRDPPSQAELRQMLSYLGGDVLKLFNTAGGAYRSLNLKEKMQILTESQKLNLLARNGNLVKRPFLIGDAVGLVGFNEETWRRSLL